MKQLLNGSFQLLFGNIKKPNYVELKFHSWIVTILNKHRKHVLQHLF